MFNQAMDCVRARRLAKRARFVVVSGLVIAACDDGGSGALSSSRPWEGDRAAVISLDGTVSEYDPGAAGECLPSSSDECIDPVQRCGQGIASDVLVDENGKVIDVLCYPDVPTTTVEEIEANDGDIAQNDNNAVIVLGGEDGDVDLEGDLDVDANNVIIYGDGPDVSSMSGNLTVDGNNTIVRGVRIQGNVQIVKNDAVLLFCVIEDNLTITANNTRISGCDVYGDVKVTGNNTKVAGSRLGGELEVEGKGTDCSDSFSFSDQDQSLSIEDAERLGPIECKGK